MQFSFFQKFIKSTGNKHLTPWSAYVLKWDHRNIFALQNRADVNKMKPRILTADFVMDSDLDFFTGLETSLKNQ